ncbi:hypothetical protein [Pontibacillus sp. HMF3514]|nr:hypothetical protein [Pontibacillus sp. HMF3514]
MLCFHLPGKWEVSQLPENKDFQVFWRKVLDDFTNGDYKEKL